MKCWTCLLFVLCGITLQGYAQWKQIGQALEGEVEHGQFGYAVSMSRDGRIVAVGEPRFQSLEHTEGRVRVFRYRNGRWERMGAPIDGENAYDYSGYSVSLSGSGERVAIGAPFNSGNGVSAGHVRVFEWREGAWVQVGQDIDGEGIESQCGWSVSISDEGSAVAVGEPGYGRDSGRVRILTLQGGAWVQKGNALIGGDDEQFGVAVSISADGNTVAIGSPFSRGNKVASGKVRVYRFEGGVWVQKGTAINGLDVGERFGWAVSLSDDGNVVAAGSVWSSVNGPNSGQTRVFAFRNGDWVQLGQSIDGDTAFENSGHSVSLNGDGSVLAVGTPRGKDNLSGYVRVYQWTAGSWIQLDQEIVGANEGDFAGYSVSLSADGQTVAIGAIWKKVDAVDKGQVRVFSRNTVGVLTPDFKSSVRLIRDYPHRIVLDMGRRYDQLHVERHLPDCTLFGCMMIRICRFFVSSLPSKWVKPSRCVRVVCAMGIG